MLKLLKVQLQMMKQINEQKGWPCSLVSPALSTQKVIWPHSCRLRCAVATSLAITAKVAALISA